MHLHWDLAKRLMMGSKRDAATRMSALMALGLMGFTALGATLVVSGNQGLKVALAESISKVHSEPDGTLTVSFQARADQEDPVIQDRLAGLLSELEEEIVGVGGEAIIYRSSFAVVAPKENLGAIQKMWLDRDAANTNKPETQPGKTRAQRIQARRDEAQGNSEYYKKSAAMGAINSEVCVVPGQHPPDGQLWAIKSKSLDSLVPPRVGTTYSVLVSPRKSGFSMPLIQSFSLAKTIDRGAHIPASCDWLVPPMAMEHIAKRLPTGVSIKSIWWAEPDMDYFFAQRNLSGTLEIDQDLYKQDWGDTKISLSGVWRKDYLVGDTMEQEAMLEVIGVISWAVVGILAVISAYQMCSLLILLGVHFNFEVAMVRSMGLSRLDIGLVFLLASCLFAGLAALVGALSGVGLVYAYNEWFGIIAARYDLHGFILLAMPGVGFWLAMGGAGVVGVLSGLFPSFMAARADPSVVWRDS